MAQFDFPSSPSTNQTYTANGVTYKWDGVAWRRITTTGAQGNTGAQGAQGVAGSTGAQGAQGVAGAAAAQGAQGATGPTGAQGAQGHQGTTGSGGSTGSQGATGATGAQGNTGATGAQGAQGHQGANGSGGSTGAQGAQGHQGHQGDAGSRSYIVTNSGAGAYVIDASNNPTLNLLRGFTYTFNINASGHPFYIKTVQTTGTGSQYTSGVTGNGTQSGTLTFAVPYNAPSTLYYICQYHGAMSGIINISDVGPTGAQGAQGHQGATGSTGAQGATGNTGAQGATAAQGAQGAVGASGSTGNTGAQGASGGTGAQGAVGAQGATGSGGSAGSTGAQGAVGAQGAQGTTGTTGSTGIPSGFIGIWSGSSASIPTGWYLCDGNNGTPDLRNRFVVGASDSVGDNTYPGLSPNSTPGGSADAILVSHTHNLQNHVHGFSASTNNQGSHTHNLLYNHGAFGGSSGAVTPRSGNTPVTPGITGRVSTEGGHTHTVSGNTGTPSTNTTDTLGESATNKNLPPYYALCYIMKS